MNQFLPRGFRVSNENRIKKMIAYEPEWQIYLTNLDIYVLAVKTTLYERWISEYSLPIGIFQDELNSGCKIFLSSGNYLVSSMEKGPFPKDNGQIEAFSIAFRTTNDIFPNIDIHNAIYIEEYSLILPTSFEANSTENGVVYGKWLTGGINISITSFNRVCRIMSWIPKELLSKYAQLAGFEVKETEEVENNNTLNQELLSQKTLDGIDTLIAEGVFSLIGRPELEQFFNDNIIDIILHQEQYKKMGISFPGATILYGPPGCGKTYAVEMLAEYLGWKRFDIDSSTIASPYIHDTSKKISDVFSSAIEEAPSILVIDEMEAFLSNRGIASPSSAHHVEEVAEFLRRIPEAISKGVLVFAMTNMLDSIDPAILRRGRFDHIIEVKMATATEIESLLITKFRDLPVDESINISEISKALDGHPMSDITFVLREAGRLAVKRNLDYINDACLKDSINLLPKKKDQTKIGFVND